MRFLVGGDTGATIHGWVVPDNPLVLSKIAVCTGGRRIAEIETSIFDENFLNYGWHSTGYCSFEITEADVPGLSGFEELELYEADTNVRIHRRIRNSAVIEKRLLLINTSIEPEITIQTALFPYFQHCYFNLNRMSDEIANSIFSGPAMPSLFLSGSINVPRYENFMMPDALLTAILFYDPHVEMARRIAWLHAQADEAVDPSQRWRLGPFTEAATIAGDCDLTDARSLRRFFQILPEQAYRLLYNPLIRQLGTRMPDDRVLPGNSIAAIEVLARLGIVGHADRFDVFAEALTDRLEIDLPPLQPRATPDRIVELAALLRTIKPVHEMLVFDLALSDMVLGTVDKIWDN